MSLYTCGSDENNISLTQIRRRHGYIKFLLSMNPHDFQVNLNLGSRGKLEPRLSYELNSSFSGAEKDFSRYRFRDV